MATIDPPKVTLDESTPAPEVNPMEIVLESAISMTDAEPSNAKAWFFRGMTLNKMDRPAEAAGPLQKAVELDPGWADAWSELGQTRAALGELAEAVAALTKVTEIQPENVDAWGTLAIYLERSGGLGPAAEAWDKAFALQPDLAKQPKLLTRRAGVLSALGRREEAVTQIDLALAALPEDEKAQRLDLLVSKSGELTKLGRSVEALDALAAAEDAAPADDSTRAALAFTRGVALNTLGRHDEASSALKKSLELLPAESPLVSFRGTVFFQLGQAQLAQSQPAEALASFREAVTLTADEDPSNIRPAAEAFIGVTLNTLGRYQEALEAMTSVEAALGDSPLVGMVQLHQGVALNALGQHEAALARLDLGLSTFPPGTGAVPPALSFQRGVALSGLKRWEEALAALDDVSKTSPAFAATVPVWNARANVLFELGRIESVLDPAPAAIAEHPIVFAYQGSVLFMARGDLGAAMELFQKAKKPAAGDPSPALGWFGYGICAQSLNRPADALDALERAGTLDPSLGRSPIVKMMRGQALSMLSRHREALTALEGAPDVEATWVARGMAHAALNESGPALQAFDRALDRAKQGGINRPVGALFASIAAGQKGLLLLKSGDATRALESFDFALGASETRPDTDPNRVLALLGKGLALNRLDKDEAEIVLQTAARASRALAPTFPSRGLSWVALGNFLTDKSREDEAIIAFDEALALEADSVSAFLGRGNALLQLEDFERAEASYSAASRHAKPEDLQDRFDALVGIGQAQTGQARYDDAVVTFRQGLAARSPELRPSPTVWLGLGGAYQGLGRPQAALRAFQNGWNQDGRPKRSRELALGVSAVLLDLKRDEEALKFLQDAQRRTRPDERLDFNLGIAHYRLKQKDKAKAAWQRASKAGLKTAESALEEMNPLQQSATGWLDYWFGEGRSRGRKIAGGALIALLGLTLVAPLINPGVIPWLNTGKDWSVTVSTVVVLAVLLLLHAIGKFSVTKDSIEVVPVQPAAGSGDAGIESVLGRLQAIGPALTPTFQPQQVPKSLGSRDTAVDAAAAMAGPNGMMMSPTVAPAIAKT